MGCRSSVFGRDPWINTIIGGVSGSITTKAALATKLTISESIIKRFEIVGSDVHAAITSDYSIGAGAFDGDLNITSYIDTGHLKGTLLNAFRNSNINTFSTSAKFNLIIAGTFKNTKLENIISYNYGMFSVESDGNIFSQNTLLKKIILPNFSRDIGNTSIEIIPLLNEVNLNSVTSMGHGNFRGNFPSLLNVELLSLESMSYNCFRDYTALQTVNLPSLHTIVNRTYVFAGLSNCTKISIKKLKTMPSYSNRSNMFTNLKTGCKIEANIFLATANAGAVDAGLEYAKTTRGAIVEFYDDAGNYVSTL